MRKFGFGAAAALAVSVLLLSGCSASTPSTESTGPVTITFTGSDDPSTYAPVIAAFEKLHANITVKYSQVPQASFDSTVLQRLKAKDSSIDVFTVDQPTIAQFAASGVLSDMSSLSAEAKKAFPSDQYKVNFYQGKMWALPVWTSTDLLFYNKDALTKAGIPFPSSDPAKPMTWQELKALAAEAQAKSGITSGFLFEDAAVYQDLLPLIGSAGGGTGITGADGLGVDVTNAGWQKALTWYSEMFDAGITPRGIGDQQPDNYFADGNSAFFISGPWSVGGFAAGSWAPATMDWGVAPMPKWDGGTQKSFTGAWSWSYNPVSKHKDADLEFIKFASLTTAGNYDTVKATTIIPSNTAAAAKYLPALEESAGTHGTGLADIISYANKNTAFARPVTVGYVQFETLIDKALSDITNGADVSSRLKQAQSEIKSALASLK